MIMNSAQNSLRELRVLLIYRQAQRVKYVYHRLPRKKHEEKLNGKTKTKVSGSVLKVINVQVSAVALPILIANYKWATTGILFR